MDGEFRKLWAGQAVSVVGSNITLIALPLTAALTLAATPQEMGLLTAAGWLPILLFSLLAGVWADRLQRRPVLIATDIARAAILGTIPVAALLGVLTIAHVLIAAFLAGAMTVLFRSAYVPFIPALVPREGLVDANARLALNESVARVLGPSLGGVLVQVVSAPVAIAADAVSFLVSAYAIASIRVTETAPDPAKRRSIWIEMGEGMRVVARNAFVRSVTIIAGIFNLAIITGETIYILYATRVLGLD
ncbi:MAG TPA: MFS transporter, partial [Candidatus Limnocylindria bacterium]|nr:MFS transporter [Candidatus Limnocylindria bacterium]